MGREWPKATALAAGAALLLVGSSACARSTRTTATAAEPTAVAVVRVSGSGTAMPVVRRLAEAYRTRHTDVQFRFESGTNSAGPIQAVVEGSLDLAASIRPLTNEQLQAGLREAPFAREAIVFAGNLVPEVNALTSAQVKDIYAGRVTSWDALGGPAEPIILLDRDADETQRKQVFLPLVDHQEPEAVVTVLNSSPDMLRQARERLPGRPFEEGDLASWNPPAGTDVLFANAVFQWVPGHTKVLQRLLAALPGGGALALQMPDNTREPALELMREVATGGDWARQLAPAIAQRDDLPMPSGYYDLLRPHCTRLDIWHSVYNHVMPGAPGIVEWFRGSALRPFLDLLSKDEAQRFVTDYSARIARAYPACHDGKVLLRFPRLFIVAVR